MFPRNKITGVKDGRIRTAASYTPPKAIISSNSKQVTASVGSTAGQAGASMSVNSYWNSQYQYMFTGLIPAEPFNTDSSQLLNFYRDIYLNDQTAGSAVDIQSSFPFSSFDLRGLREQDLDIYTEAVEQLNILQMLPIISTAYLTDGYFCGSLVFDPKDKRFLNTLMHDAMQCQVVQNSFFNNMPEINVQTSPGTMQMLNSNSQYTREYINSLPQSFVNMLRQGSFDLNPVTTLFVARRTLIDRSHVSFLHRILPMYLIEKMMYKGTLVEASRRQRATTHMAAGDDTWTPTSEELNALVQQFQAAEFDPLGGWVSTRNAISIQDIRPGGDFWKWTDMADTMVPYKLRALGISESFLSGDASYASAESAYSTFLETQNTYRDQLTQAVFYNRLFPLIAVANRMYKEGTPKSAMASNSNLSSYLSHSKNRAALRIPQLIWHKSLEAKDEENTFELLEAASEKGVPIPLKAWMAAAKLDKDSLLKDLKEDKALRKNLEAYTGKETSHEDEQQIEAAVNKRFTTTAIANSGIRKPLLSREWAEPDMFVIGKTGKRQHVVNNPRGKTTDENARMARIHAKASRDPHYAKELRERNQAKLGYTTLDGNLSNRKPGA